VRVIAHLAQTSWNDILGYLMNYDTACLWVAFFAPQMGEKKEGATAQTSLHESTWVTTSPDIS